MKLAIIGSRNLRIDDLDRYLPDGVTEIISGGARGVDASAREYAYMNQIKYTEYIPDYQRYGRGAPLKRNDIILERADQVLAFWDGESRGTKYVIERCQMQGKPIIVIQL